AVDADEAGHLPTLVAPREVARLQPRAPSGQRAVRLDHSGLAAARAREQAVESGLAEKLQERLGRATQRGGPRDAGELLHGGIPGDDGETGVGDDHRVIETVNQALAKALHASPEYNNCQGRSLQWHCHCLTFVWTDFSSHEPARDADPPGRGRL